MSESTGHDAREVRTLFVVIAVVPFQRLGIRLETFDPRGIFRRLSGSGLAVSRPWGGAVAPVVSSQ